MSFPHQLASGQAREIRAFLVGCCLDRSGKILKPKGYQHLGLLLNRNLSIARPLEIRYGKLQPSCVPSARLPETKVTTLIFCLALSWIL